MEGLLRPLFAMLDTAVYSLINAIYKLLMDIADVQIFSDSTLGKFTERVYAILGIFMAFKLIFTFINYAVNPDLFADQKTGGKRLVVDIIVALVLLIAVPTVIFPLARQLQTAILNENVIQEVILGVDSKNYGMAMNKDNSARNMSFTILHTFLYPSVCDEKTIRFYEDTSAPTNLYEQGGYNEDGTPNGNAKNFRYKLDGDCAEKIKQSAKGNAETIVLAYEEAYNYKSYRKLLGGSDDTNLKKLKGNNGEYLFDYKILISTIAGGGIVYLLFMFCFDVAVRTIKLAFLELAAPIPILFYIDPKTRSKSQGYLNTAIKVYMSLFIYLAVLYLAVFIINSISLGDIHFAKGSSTEGEPVGLLVKFFIILGALIFVKNAPQFFEEAIGFKIDGKFQFNPLKKSPFFAAAAGGTVGALSGAVFGTYSNLKAHQANGDFSGSKVKALKSALGGVTSGLGAGAMRGMIAGGKEQKLSGGFKKGMTAATVGSKKIQEQAHTSFWGRKAAVIAEKTGTKSKGEQLRAQVKSYGEIRTQMDTLKDVAAKEIEKKADTTVVGHYTYKDSAGVTHTETGTNIARQKTVVATLKSRDMSDIIRRSQDTTQPLAVRAAAQAELTAHYNKIVTEEAKLASATKQANKEMQQKILEDYNSGNPHRLAELDIKAVTALNTIKTAMMDNPSYFDSLGVNMSSGHERDFIDNAVKNISAAEATIINGEEFRTATANADYAKNIVGGNH